MVVTCILRNVSITVVCVCHVLYVMLGVNYEAVVLDCTFHLEELPFTSLFVYLFICINIVSIIPCVAVMGFW